MKKLFTLFIVLATTVMVANAQIDSLYIVSVATPEYYNEEMDCLDLTNWCADTLVIYDDDPNANEFNILWYSMETDGPWMHARSIMITKENEGHWIFKNERTNAFAEFMITLATTPEELTESFEYSIELLGECVEIYAYEGEENEKLSCLWNDGETAFSRMVYDGTYIVTVSDSCGRSVQNTWLVGDYTGIHEAEAAPSVYPNPSNGIVTIEGKGTYTIYNAVGQLVETVETDGKREIVLPSGMYFIRNDETAVKIVVR